MKKEEVLYVNLPDGADYRRAEVTEDGRLAVFYTKNCVNSKETIKVKGSIPRPKPLIGGTEVYQKDNGTPYWYCRIKDGRDEFMHIYFDDLTEKDLLYDANGKERHFITEKQEKFKADVMKALKKKTKRGYSWIPVYEPSMNKIGDIYYLKEQYVTRGLFANEWEYEIARYSPRNGSKVASITTYFLLLLRWLKDGIATIEQLAENSKDIGHYFDTDNAQYRFEKTGEREFGGLYGFVGNTCKIVKDSESKSGFSSLGGHYDNLGHQYPLADVYNLLYNCEDNFTVGLLELTK